MTGTARNLFILAIAYGLLGMMFLAGNPGIEPVLGLTSIAFFLGMVLFAWVARPARVAR
jgi:hypothetical protein